MTLSTNIMRCIILTSFTAATADKVEMRIVDEPTSYSWQNNNAEEKAEKMKMRVDPSPFSGPEHLRRLDKRCFKKTLSKYEYEFCPFSNMTQKEIDTTAWNPYQGILGVWQEWNIKDNKFTSMRMLMGEQCGANPRQAEIILRCGETHEIANVTEPQHCEYAITFLTPLVCHDHSLLVYPTLEQSLRTRWDQLKSELLSDEITEKGYKVALNKIFQDGGLKMKPKGEIIPPMLKKTDSNSKSDKYTNIDICNTEYEELKAELEQTKAQLQRFLS